MPTSKYPRLLKILHILLLPEPHNLIVPVSKVHRLPAISTVSILHYPHQYNLLVVVWGDGVSDGGNLGGLNSSPVLLILVVGPLVASYGGSPL